MLGPESLSVERWMRVRWSESVLENGADTGPAVFADTELGGRSLAQGVQVGLIVRQACGL